MATRTGFFSLVGASIKADLIAVFEYFKSIYNHGDIDYASAVTTLVVICVLSFFFVMFPRTIIIVCFVIWRMYAHVVDEDDYGDEDD